jgi:hypothetical protein
MSGLGQTLHFDTPAMQAECPLCSESDRLPSSCISVAAWVLAGFRINGVLLALDVFVTCRLHYW